MFAGSFCADANADGSWHERQPEHELEWHAGQSFHQQPHDATPEFNGHEWNADGWGSDAYVRFDVRICHAYVVGPHVLKCAENTA